MQQYLRHSKRYFGTAESQLKKTKLCNFHKANGGKLVDFAGFYMPVQYNNMSIQDSTLHTRKNASIFDVSHMGQLRFYGTDRIEFLEHILVGSAKPLKPNQVKYSLMCNQDGGIIDDLVFANIAENDYHYMVINAGRIAEDLSHIDDELNSFEAKGKNCRYDFIDTDSLIAFQGPTAVQTMKKLNPDFNFDELKFFYLTQMEVKGIPLQVSRTGYTGEDGFEIAVNNDKAEEFVEMLLNENGVELAGLGARDSLRLEAGLCLYGNDIDETITAVEADLLWTISKKRKENSVFIGSDVIRNQIKNGIDRKRVGLIGKKGLTPRHDMKILDVNGNDIGIITSGSFSPCLQLPISMGYVNMEYTEIGTELKVEIRNNKTVDVKVCELPFVPKGYFK
eukprot:117331_1